MTCIFCKIIKGEIPSGKIYEDDTVLAFLDINPANKGHALVLPKAHYGNIFDVPEPVLSKTIEIVKKIATAVLKVTNCDGVNILQNNNKAAGQLVPHIHFHIIPRFENDSVNFSYKGTKYGGGELEDVQKRIIDEL